MRCESRPASFLGKRQKFFYKRQKFSYTLKVILYFKSYP